MAMLAMWALGARRADLEAYAADYKDRLDPPVEHTNESARTFAESMGDLSAYGFMLRYFDRQIATHGIRATLATHLPTLISGWVRFAFHPIIRLAYGIRFGVESEVAAGLAYLTCAGPDDKLRVYAEAASRQPKFELPGLFATIVDAPFEQRYNATMASGALASRVAVVADNRHVVAELGLALFNDTHDFFALHIVTGTHALGICADAIGLDVDGLLSAGVLAAYLTIGAPRIDLQRTPTPTHIDDEHDAKMAFSCLDQARRLRSKRFEEAASVYASRQVAPQAGMFGRPFSAATYGDSSTLVPGREAPHRQRTG